ncbi:NAD(P)/FAD-dependent oxidoreductase [Sphingomonas aurantiaca]|uniref:NAD(P)/FAD-dependent oxidoreductase n=1 Tax=Sphingomonas aurantiaca TaxID=185949 RepID=UPI003A5BF30F
MRFTGSGQIVDLRRLATTLEAAVSARGGRIVREAARLTDDAGRTGIAEHDVDLVLVTAGVRSRALLEPLGYRVPMIAERGYHIRARADGWPADLPPLVFEDHAMIVTRYADCVQAASFVELGDPDAPPDPRKWARLEHHVRTLGLPIEGPFERWMGARPTLPDYLPAIGRSTRSANLVYAFGHQHLGLTLAPVTAQLVAALVAGTAPAVSLAPFDLDRFAKKDLAHDHRRIFDSRRTGDHRPLGDAGAAHRAGRADGAARQGARAGRGGGCGCAADRCGGEPALFRRDSVGRDRAAGRAAAAGEGPADPGLSAL